MKIRFFVISIILLIALTLVMPGLIGSELAAQEDRACFPPPAGLTGWWPGDGNAEDIIGGRDGTLEYNATTGPGYVDEAFILDGVEDFVSVAHDPALNLGAGDFTINLWVYFNDTTGEQVLIEKWIQSDPYPQGWTLTKLDGNALRLALATGSSDEIDVDSEQLSIPNDTWIQFTATRKGGMITLYMNGVPVAVGTADHNLDSDSSLKFGHRGNPSDTPGSVDERGFYLNGKMDEVQLFAGNALPRGLFQAMFNAGSAGLCKG